MKKAWVYIGPGGLTQISFYNSNKLYRNFIADWPWLWKETIKYLWQSHRDVWFTYLLNLKILTRRPALVTSGYFDVTLSQHNFLCHSFLFWPVGFLLFVFWNLHWCCLFWATTVRQQSQIHFTIWSNQSWIPTEEQCGKGWTLTY